MGGWPNVFLTKFFHMEVLEREKLQIVKESIAVGMDCPDYRQMVGKLAAEGKTTGEEQSEARINYTQLNDRRMKRWDKTFTLSAEVQEKLSNLETDLVLLTITESWCGDAAASLPVINKIAEASPKIEHKVVLRDQHPELMEAFLTNGAQSIPKVIVVDRKNNEILGDWGPRPNLATQMVDTFKKEHGKLTDAFKQDLQVWYNKDKGENILNDFLELLGLE